MKRKEMIKCIADFYGNDNQVKKTIEELAELIRALSRENYENVVEEIADVEIMLAQVKYLIGIPKEEINAVKDEKLDRIAAKIVMKGVGLDCEDDN